ncbi:MAG TPA: ABC transporter substrate-binding protein [Caldimonas sp.]|jgi:putative ABC transport system substrate-binding protein
MLASIAAAAADSAFAQRTATRLPRIALVFNGIPASQMAGPDPADPPSRAFVYKLREIGLVEGRSVVIERRSAEGRPERIPGLMEELVRLGVDVIVCNGQAIKSALAATNTVAIVAIVDSGDPDPLKRAARNITGIGEPPLHAKRLQFLKEAASAVTRVAVLGNIGASDPSEWPADLVGAATSLRLELVWVEARVREDLDSAFSTVLRERTNGLYAMATQVNSQQARRISDFAASHLLPTVGGSREGAWLLSYDSDYSEKMRRAAELSKAILDGARAADLPFEQPTKYSLVINLKRARDIGLTIPRSLLLRADEVID